MIIKKHIPWTSKGHVFFRTDWRLQIFLVVFKNLFLYLVQLGLRRNLKSIWFQFTNIFIYKKVNKIKGPHSNILLHIFCNANVIYYFTFACCYQQHSIVLTYCTYLGTKHNFLSSNIRFTISYVEISLSVLRYTEILSLFWKAGSWNN